MNFDDFDDFEIKNKEVFIGTVVFFSLMITGCINGIVYNSFLYRVI